MSGGHYDYAYLKVIEFGDCIERDLTEPKDWMDYSPACILKLKQIAAEAAKFAGTMKDVEWLLSGDVSEATFMKRVDEEKPVIAKMIEKMIIANDAPLPPEVVPLVWDMLKEHMWVSRGSSLHVKDATYKVNGYKYTAYWELSQTSEIPFEITFRKLPA